jgi:hypothetical protein
MYCVVVNSHVLVAIHVVMLIMIVILFSESSSEEQLFRFIVERSVSSEMPTQDRVVAILHRTHAIMEPSSEAFAGYQPSSLRERFLASADVALREGLFACGGFSHALARALEVAGFEVRIAQMLAADRGDGGAIHVIVEAKVDGRWVVLDPLYDLAFFRDDGRLATVADLRSDWDRYRTQLPRNYSPSYNYSGIRHTHWDRIPGFANIWRPLLLDFLNAEQFDGFCFRSYFLNLYKTYALALSAFYFLLTAATVVLMGRRIVRRRHERAESDRRTNLPNLRSIDLNRGTGVLPAVAGVLRSDVTGSITGDSAHTCPQKFGIHRVLRA